MPADSITTTHAARIRALHHEAHRLADAAIGRAIEAGALLAEVKATLPHGEFGAWVAEHCGFTDRTARRYLRLHAHRESLPSGLGVKAALEHLKTDTVSDLPSWLPTQIESAVFHGPVEGAFWFAARIDAEFVRALKVTVVNGSDDSLVEGFPRGIRNDALGTALQMLGLPSPASAKWEPADAAYLRGLADWLKCGGPQTHAA